MPTVESLQLERDQLKSLLRAMKRIVGYRGTGDSDIELYGADVEEITGTRAGDGLAQLTRWYNHINPEDLPAYKEAERKRRDSGEGFEITFRYTHPDTGERKWLLERAYCVVAADGTRYNDGYIIDITAEREREEAQRAALHELKRAQMAQTQFLANISHELRTPLNAIIGFSDMIRDVPPNPYEKDQGRDSEYAGAISSAARTLLRLIEDLIDLSRAEAGRLTIEDGSVDLQRTLTQANKIIEEDRADRGITLEVTLAEDARFLVGDERRLKQLLGNLLSNAVKFSPKGGHVAVRSEVREDNSIIIAVRDDGPGIPAAILAQISRPFVQGDAGLDRRYGGAGLGLPLAKRLAELHDGWLELESREQEGTEARVVLPPSRRLVTPAIPGTGS